MFRSRLIKVGKEALECRLAVPQNRRRYLELIEEIDDIAAHWKKVHPELFRDAEK